MSDFPNIHAAAVLYSEQSSASAELALYAEQMKSRGWKVGGLVQVINRDSQGQKTGVDAVALDTGDRFPIVRPSKEDIAAGTCGLDRSALANSGSALRRAIDEKVDLLIVEKYGEREQLGEGLADDILSAMAEGIPVLVAVPAGVVEKWTEFTGGLGDLLPSSPTALQRWWPRENLYEELIRSIPTDPVKQIIVGLNWILVEGPDGCGLSHTPERGTNGCRSVPETGKLAQKNLQELAQLARSWHPFEAAIGIAAINAFFNRYDLKGETTNGLDTLQNTSGPVTVIGGFRKIEEKFKNLQVIELDPTDTQYPQSAASSLLPTSEAAIITASTLPNKTLPDLLKNCGENITAVIGPGTPLAPSLRYYGVDILSGLIVQDVKAVANVIGAGGSVKDIKPHCRYLTLRF